MSTPHLPFDDTPTFRDVVPLGLDIGTAAGHRLLLLSVERWRDWCDLRFARIDVEATHRLTRRVPPGEAWSVRVDGTEASIIDVTGRGDRAFSNGEIRFTPSPRRQARLDIAVTVAAGTPQLATTLLLPAAPRDDSGAPAND